MQGTNVFEPLYYLSIRRQIEVISSTKCGGSMDWNKLSMIVIEPFFHLMNIAGVNALHIYRASKKYILINQLFLCVKILAYDLMKSEINFGLEMLTSEICIKLKCFYNGKKESHQSLLRHQE